MALDEPEVWVKTLAVLLERYRGNSDATFAVLVRLINLGLVQVVHDPSRPEQMVLDTRTLEYYLERYGPKITTSSGELGVAAGQGEIWTPDSGRGGWGAPLLTPGAAAPDRSRSKAQDHPLRTLSGPTQTQSCSRPFAQAARDDGSHRARSRPAHRLFCARRTSRAAHARIRFA
jgi:hypothetical protein